MKSATIAMGAAALLAAQPAWAKKETYVHGQAPDWERYKELGEAAVRARLANPENWTIEWPQGFIKAGTKAKSAGYFTCGLLRPPSSAHVGPAFTYFQISIDHDTVKDIRLKPGERRSMWNLVCGYMIARGMLPPASLMEEPRDLAAESLGITVRPLPEGAYVASVASGSPTERAGVRQGMVLTRVNGIALAGMGPAMARVLDSDTMLLSLESAAGDRIAIERAPRMQP